VLDGGSKLRGDVAYLTPELKVTLASQLEREKALERRLGRIVPYVFPHSGRGPRAGQRRRDFRKAWVTACSRRGCPGGTVTTSAGPRCGTWSAVESRAV
jgi:hypothetical protein